MNQQNFGIKNIKSPKDLEQYLIQWRLSLWQSIRHKETILWSFAAFYLAAVGIVFGSIQYINIPLYVGVLVIVTLSTWGIMVVMDAAMWAARNLFTISRIEKLFIMEGANQLIPGIYLDPKFRYQDIYKVHIFFYSVVTLGVYFKYALDLLGYDRLSQPSESVPFLLVTIVTLAAFYLIRRWEKRLILRSYFTVFRDEFSIDIDGTQLQPVSQKEKDESVLKSPGWICSTWVIATVAALAISITGLNLLKAYPYVFFAFLVIWCLLGLASVIIWWGEKLTYNKGYRIIMIFVRVSLILVILSFLTFIVVNFTTQFDPNQLITSYLL